VPLQPDGEDSCAAIGPLLGEMVAVSRGYR
jgi:hypothetical protein